MNNNTVKSQFSDLILKSLKASGIHPDFIDLITGTFQSETNTDFNEHTLTGLKVELGFTTASEEDKRRWSKELEAYWFISEDGSKWQSILNLSDLGKDGSIKRLYRYIAPKGSGDIVYFPSVPFSIRRLISERFGIPIGGEPANAIPSDGQLFWPWFCKFGFRLLPLAVTEGGKKALSLLSQGIPAIALYGCSCGVTEVTETNKKGEIERVLQPKEVLKKFCGPGGRVVIALDNDAQSKKATHRTTEKAKNRLWTALRNHGCNPVRIQWTADFKGVDDLIFGDLEHFNERFEQSLHPEKLDQLQLMELRLLTHFGARIRFNELKQRVELDGSELGVETIKKWWSDHFNEVQRKEDIFEVLIDYARKNSYHPVKEYLAGLRGKILPSIDFNHLASWIFGTNEELFNIYLRKQLIAAIARLFNPGCKVDTTLVLQGPQGIGKSSFFQSLALKPQWFDDSLSASNLSDKDEKMKIHHSWILELAELEALYRRKDVAQVRSLLSTSHDKIRLPYHPKITEMPRQSTFWASVNSGEFLVDTEGNRRFMVIPVQAIRRLTLLEVESLWLSALTAYESGEVWWLNEVEQELQRRENKGFEESDIWQHSVEDYCENRDKVTVSEILTNAIQMPLERHSRRESDRVIKVLKQLGYTKQQERKGGDRGKRFWFRGIGTDGTQEHISTPPCSIPCSTQNTVPVPVSPDWNRWNTDNGDEKEELGINGVDVSNQSPSTNSDGSTGTPPTPFSTENPKDPKYKKDVFHKGDETTENGSGSGLQGNTNWNTSVEGKNGENPQSGSGSGSQGDTGWNTEWNTSPNRSVPFPGAIRAKVSDFKKHTVVRFFCYTDTSSYAIEGWLHNTYVYFQDQQGECWRVYQHDVSDLQRVG